MVRKQNCFVIVFDLTRAETLQKAVERYQQIVEMQGTDMTAVFVGNKSDFIECREIAHEEG